MNNPKEVVDELNSLIWGENAGHEEFFNDSFEYAYNGICEIISYNNSILWNSAWEEREFDEDLNDYTDLLEHCKKEFCKIGNQMLMLNKLINKSGDIE